MFVEVQGDNLEIALREFKRKMKKEGIMQDIKKKEYFIKPSKKAKMRHLEAIKRKKQEEREQKNERKRPSNGDSRRDY